MTPIAENDFTTNLFTLLVETFEGPPRPSSAYLDQGAGLFQTIDPVDHETASHAQYPGAATVAAHVAHVAYYVDVLRNVMAGREQTIDWKACWTIGAVTADAWDRMRAELRASYADLRAELDAVDAWGDEHVGDSMAIVVHTAYHLGAIRQILKALAAAA